MSFLYSKKSQFKETQEIQNALKSKIENFCEVDEHTHTNDEK